MNGIDNNEVATLSLLRNVGYGYGGNHANFAYDGSVINTNVEANRAIGLLATDRIVDNQKQGFDAITATQNAIAAVSAEGRLNDKFAGLNALLFNQLNQIDRRFSDAQLSAQECCCELKAGQASILAKLDAAEQVRNAVQNAEQGIKLNQLLAALGNGNGNGNNRT